jgi:hypothetical protein
MCGDSVKRFKVGDRVVTKEGRAGVVDDVYTSWTYFVNGKEVKKRMLVYSVRFDGMGICHAISHKSNNLRSEKVSA